MAIRNARLNQALRLSERRYRRIFEGSNNMIFVVSPAGRLLDINPAGIALLGYATKSQALKNVLFPDCFYPLRDWDRFRIFLEAHGSVQDWEVTLTRRDGGRIQVLLSGIARRSRAGRLSGFDVIAKNITERKRIEQEILQEKKTTEGILEGLPVPVFVIDRQHRITYWNKACEELTGYTRQEMVGTQKQWLPVYPQERPTLADLVVDQNVKALEYYYGSHNLRQSSHFPGAFESSRHFLQF